MEQGSDPPASERPTSPAGSPKEIALSAVWQEQGFQGPLRTTDGRAVDVIARGTWTHGFGPDFRDALIAFDGYELRAGSVEVHLASSSWYAHGHDRDPRYNDVILHVVLTQDRAETRRADGGIVPTVVVGELLERPLTDAVASTADWSRFGGEACAPRLTRDDPAIVRQILFRLGDARLASREARLEARLTAEPPAQVLYEAIWDGLGYHQNRDPMRRVAQTVPLADLERLMATVAISDRLNVARGILLGVAGFLPLSPTEASFGHLAPDDVLALEEAWGRYGAPWHASTLAPSSWTRARVRPANHPVTRLVAGAALLSATIDLGGLVAAVLGPIRARGLGAADGQRTAPDLAQHLRALTSTETAPGLGLDRAVAIVASAILPFAMALAEHTEDYGLLDATAAVWERLAGAGENQVTRRARAQVTGGERLAALGARGQQGLIHLDQALCAPRRCFECPIARAVLASELESPDSRFPRQ